jgi:hypothetical protein
MTDMRLARRHLLLKDQPIEDVYFKTRDGYYSK